MVLKNLNLSKPIDFVHPTSIDAYACYAKPTTILRAFIEYIQVWTSTFYLQVIRLYITIHFNALMLLAAVCKQKKWQSLGITLIWYVVKQYEYFWFVRIDEMNIQDNKHPVSIHSLIVKVIPSLQYLSPRNGYEDVS